MRQLKFRIELLHFCRRRLTPMMTIGMAHRRRESPPASPGGATHAFRISVHPALDGVGGLSRFSCSTILLACLTLTLVACDSAPPVQTSLPIATATTAVSA